MNSWPSTGTCAPRCGSTSVANPRPMVSEMLCPANTRDSNATCTTMPIATPMSSSVTIVNIPAAENIDKPVGTSIKGPSKKASDSVSTIFTRLGTTPSLAMGAASTKPPTRKAGHHMRPTQVETSETFSVRGCMRSADHRGYGRVQVVREIDQDPEDPGTRDKQGQDQHE